MQEEFEKKIQERMHTFGMQPSYQVWDDIDAVLSKKKHRRVFVGWWILLGLIAVGGGVFFYERDNIKYDRIDQQPAVTKDTLNNNLAKIPPPTIEKTYPAKTTPSNASANDEVVQQQAGKEKGNEETITPNTNKTGSKQLTQNKLTAIGKGNITAAQSGTQVVQGNIPPVQNNKPADITAVNRGDKKPGEESAVVNTPPAADKEPPAALQSGDKTGDDKQQAIPAEATKKVTDVTPNDLPAKPGANTFKAKGARHQWLFTVAGGTTQTIAHGSINQEKSSALTASAYNITGVTSLAAYKYDLVKPGTGFHVAAGGVYQYSLAKKWRVSVGLQVAYLSNTQKTGLLYYNSFFTQSNNPAANNSITFSTGRPVASYYQAQSGALNTEVNKAWQLQLPVTATYTVNPAGKTKFMLNGGVSAGWMFSSHWLIPDSRYGKLYYSKSSLNNTLFSWQAGPAVELHNQLQLGLRYEQSITTFAKKYVTPNLYWQNISIYAAIPFKGKAKK